MLLISVFKAQMKARFLTEGLPESQDSWLFRLPGPLMLYRGSLSSSCYGFTYRALTALAP